MSWKVHPASLRHNPEPLIKLLAAHMHSRMLLSSVQAVEASLMERVMDALSSLPSSEQERLLSHCVDEASRRIVPMLRDEAAALPS